MKLTPAEIEGW